MAGRSLTTEGAALGLILRWSSISWYAHNRANPWDLIPHSSAVHRTEAAWFAADLSSPSASKTLRAKSLKYVAENRNGLTDKANLPPAEYLGLRSAKKYIVFGRFISCCHDYIQVKHVVLVGLRKDSARRYTGHSNRYSNRDLKKIDGQEEDNPVTGYPTQQDCKDLI